MTTIRRFLHDLVRGAPPTTAVASKHPSSAASAAISAADFATRVMPQIVSAWEASCFCRSPGFLKLLSFDFRRYGGPPRALHDLEAIGYEIVGRRFETVSGWRTDPDSGASVSVLACPRCGTRCTRRYEQFNIHFDSTCYDFETTTRPAETGLFLIGFYGLGESWAPPDFERAASAEQFLQVLGV